MAIGPGHRKTLAGPPTAGAARGTTTAEHREQIVEIADVELALRLILPALRAFSMRPIGISRPLRAALVDLAAVVARPLLRVGQQIVGRSHRLEARFGRTLARVQIGVGLL